MIPGSLEDPGLVDRVVSGATAVIIAFGPRPPFRDPFCARATGAVLGAMRRTGVRRLLCQTGAMIGELPRNLSPGMRLMAGLFRWRRPEVARDRAEQERLVTGSRLAWTVVKPPRLTQGPAQQGYRADPSLRLSLLDAISRADVARFYLDEIPEPRFVEQRVYVAGPRSRPRYGAGFRLEGDFTPISQPGQQQASSLSPGPRTSGA